MEITPKSYVAFFDLDRTILNINSGSILVRQAHKKKIMSNPDFLRAIYYSLLYKFHFRETDLIIAGMGSWLKGIAVDKVTELSTGIVNQFLLDSIRPEIYSEINIHKLKNAEVVILSSAIEEICKPIAENIGFDNFICTRMSSVNGIFTGTPENKFCFGEEKRIRLENYCESMNYRLSDAYYYGDSIADLPALEVTGHPICVAPDKKLTKIAIKRRWEIKEW